MKKLFLALFICISQTAFAQVNPENTENIRAANEKCVKQQTNYYGLTCIETVSKINFIQTELLELCLSKKNEDVGVFLCFQKIGDQRFTGIFLKTVLVQCNNQDETAEWTSNCIKQVANMRDKISNSQQGEGQIYRMPEDTQFFIPQEVVVYAGKPSGLISVNNAKKMRCDAYINRETVAAFDQEFSPKVLKLVKSNIILNKDSVKIDILDDNDFISVICNGGIVPNPEDRKALEQYFLDGGMKLKIPDPKKR